MWSGKKFRIDGIKRANRLRKRYDVMSYDRSSGGSIACRSWIREKCSAGMLINKTTIFTHQPRHTKARSFADMAAASEEARRYKPRVVWPFES